MSRREEAMADWVDIFYIMKEWEEEMPCPSMGCSVASTPKLGENELALANFEFALNPDGTFAYVTLVPKVKAKGCK